MSIATKKRFLWADLMRIFAIYFVIATHLNHAVSSQGIGSILHIVSIAITHTGVPLFVMLSGSLLLGRKGESYKIFFTKRFTRIIYPWFFWTIIYSLVNLSQTNSLTEYLGLVRQILISFWFLPMIVGLYFITPTIRLFIQKAKKQDILYIIIIWFIVISLLPNLRNTSAFPLHVDNSLLRQVLNYSGFYLLGYYLTLVKRNQKLKILLILGGIFSLPYIILNNNFNYISPGIIIFSIVIFSIIYHIGNRSGLKVNSFFVKTTVSMSGSALGIYFIHELLASLYRSFSGNYFLINLNLPIDNFLNALVLFLTSFFIILLLKQIPLLKKIVA